MTRTVSHYRIDEATPPEHKRHVTLEGGHVSNDVRGVLREVLNWYDIYFGPVHAR